MNDKQKNILKGIYNEYKNNKFRLLFSSEPSALNAKTYHDMEYLNEKGYIKITNKFIDGSYIVKITSKGIDAVENDFQEPMPVSINQGNNSIFINGSNNVVTDNYSVIYNNLQQSDICDEHKKLISQLLQELKETPKENFSDKVKTFLMKLTEKGVDVAINTTLPALITELMSKIF